jgi:hypothetical protein
MGKDRGLQVLVGKTIEKVTGDHVGFKFELSDGSTVEVQSSGQDSLEIKRTHEVTEKKKVKVTKDLV